MKLSLDKLIQAILPKGNATQILKKGESEFVSLLSNSLSETPPSPKVTNKKLANTPPVEKPAVSLTKRYSKSDTELKNDFRITDTEEKIVPHETQAVAAHVTDVSNDRQLDLNLDETTQVTTTASRKEFRPKSVLEKIWQPILSAVGHSDDKKTVEPKISSAQTEESKQNMIPLDTKSKANKTPASEIKPSTVDDGRGQVETRSPQTAKPLDTTRIATAKGEAGGTASKRPFAESSAEEAPSVKIEGAAKASRSVEATRTAVPEAENSSEKFEPAGVRTHERVAPSAAKSAEAKPNSVLAKETTQEMVRSLAAESSVKPLHETHRPQVRADVKAVVSERSEVPAEKVAQDVTTPRLARPIVQSERVPSRAQTLQTPESRPTAQRIDRSPVVQGSTLVETAPETVTPMTDVRARTNDPAPQIRPSAKHTETTQAQSHLAPQPEKRSEVSQTSTPAAPHGETHEARNHTHTRVTSQPQKQVEAQAAPARPVQHDLKQANVEKLEQVAPQDSKQPELKQPSQRFVQQDVKQQAAEQISVRVSTPDLKQTEVKHASAQVILQDAEPPILKQTETRVISQDSKAAKSEQAPIRVSQNETKQFVQERVSAQSSPIDTKPAKSEHAQTRVAQSEVKQPHVEQVVERIVAQDAKPSKVEHAPVQVAQQDAKSSTAKPVAERVVAQNEKQPDLEQIPVRVSEHDSIQPKSESATERVVSSEAKLSDIKQTSIPFAPHDVKQQETEQTSGRVTPPDAKPVEVEKVSERVVPQASKQLDVKQAQASAAPQPITQEKVEQAQVRVAPQMAKHTDIEHAPVKVVPLAVDKADVEDCLVCVAPQMTEQEEAIQTPAQSTSQAVEHEDIEATPIRVAPQSARQPEVRQASMPVASQATKPSAVEKSSTHVTPRVEDHATETNALVENQIEDQVVVPTIVQSFETKRETVVSPAREVQTNATTKQESLHAPYKSEVTAPTEAKRDVSKTETKANLVSTTEPDLNKPTVKTSVQNHNSAPGDRPIPVMSEPVRQTTRPGEMNSTKLATETPKETLRTHSTPLAANSSSSKMLPLDSLKLPADVVRELSSLLKFEAKPNAAETLITRAQPITPDVTLFFKPVETHAPQNVVKPTASPIDLPKSPETQTQKSASDVIQNTETVKQETPRATQTPIARMPNATQSSTTPEVMPTIKPNIVPDARTIVPPFAQTPPPARTTRVESNSSARSEAQSERTTQTVNAGATEKNSQTQNQNYTESQSHTPDRDPSQTGARATVDHTPQTTPHTAATRSQTMQQHALNESLKVALQQALEMSRKRLVEPNELRLSVPLGDMGTMDIDVVRDSEKLAIRIGADQHALAVLEEQKPYLTQWLRDQGYPVEQLDLAPRSNGNPNTGLNSSDTSAQDRQASRSQQSGSSRSGSPTDLADLSEPAARPTTSGRHVWTA